MAVVETIDSEQVYADGRLDGCALLSNGASRVVEPYHLAGWPEVIDLLRTTGPDEIIRRVREVETDSLRPDDATAAYCEFGP